MTLALGDFSRLNISDGVIHYRLYRQDGTFQPMTCRDTQSNRLFVSWVQKFDRYTEAGEAGANPAEAAGEPHRFETFSSPASPAAKGPNARDGARLAQNETGAQGIVTRQGEDPQGLREAEGRVEPGPEGMRPGEGA
jgi:hypothetical protein